jgi:hypothetical protein
MEDKIITIVFGSLGATLALVSILFTYLQLRGSRTVVVPDEEQSIPLARVPREESVVSPPAVVAVQEELVTSPPAVMAQENPVTNPPYASRLPTQLYHRTDNVTDASPKIDLLSC